jgi:hypothetical protein
MLHQEQKEEDVYSESQPLSSLCKPQDRRNNEKFQRKYFHRERSMRSPWAVISSYTPMPSKTRDKASPRAHAYSNLTQLHYHLVCAPLALPSDM